MWRDKIREIEQEKIIYGEKINCGATADEIRLFLKEIKKEFKLGFPMDYIRVLQTVNGIEFNGFILYGIDQHLLEEPPNQSVNGLIESNRVWHENEWQNTYVFLGESSISWYVYDVSDGEYYELDSPSGRKIEKFQNLDNLIEKLLSDALV